MIGIIGFGRFGKLTARYLAEEFDVAVYHRTDKSGERDTSSRLHPGRVLPPSPTSPHAGYVSVGASD